MAASTTGVPQGIIHQKTYVRKEGTQSKEYKKIYKKIPIEQKESVRWVETLQVAHRQLAGKRVVVIGDRESDIFDVFAQAREKNLDVLIRTAWNGLVAVPRGEGLEYLFDRARKGKKVVSYKTEVPISKSHKTRPAVLTIRASAFLMPPPKHRRKQISPVSLSLIDVVEDSPPEGFDPIHWMLTTTIPVKTADDAIEKVVWYMYRWRTEQFHYILKTGAFNVEKLQFETFPRFKKAMSMFSIVAWRILWTTYQVRKEPNQDARVVFSKEEVRAIQRIHKSTSEEITLKEAVMEIAKLGGFLGRTRDGLPGVKVLWRGFNKLQFIVYGMTLVEIRE